MKNRITRILILLSFFLAQTHGKPQVLGDEPYPFQPVSFTQVKIEDHFWGPRIETNRRVTIPYDFRKCEETGRINNFAVAAGVKEGKFKGNRYDDSDVFKIIEGASYSLQQHYDPLLDAYLDSVIGLIAGAQEEDGYLYTSRTIDPQNPAKNSGDQRWSFIAQSHELYNAGHMYEAAVAHYLATRKKTFLEVAIKNANLICAIFGPGRVRMVPGHEEIEIGLVRLFRVTGDKKYLDMARFFLDERGNKKGHKLFGEYCQDHIPVTKQFHAVGHAVRAGYLYCGMADVAALTGEPSYIRAISQIWSNVVEAKIYLTGGIGARHEGEAFGDDYELPNATAYNETCAAIANAMWNHRMFLLFGESKYIDVLERILYNGFLSGVSLEGDKFFYPNPLECKGECQRKPWFDCSCCPSNVVRFLPSIPGYIYAVKGNSLYVNLYIGSTASVRMNGQDIGISQETGYPWDGKIKLRINSPDEKNLKIMLRIPGWAGNQVVPSNLYSFADSHSSKPLEIKVNNKKSTYTIKDGYAIIDRTWKTGDEIMLEIPMEVKRIVSNEKVEANRGREAYQRGPIVYCLEGIDNNDNALNASVSDKKRIGYAFEPDLLNGVGVLIFKGQQVSMGENPEIKDVKLKAIPYYAWAHRGESSMAVWLPQKLK